MNKIFDAINASVRGLIFDLDGTLIDSMSLHYESYNYALQEYGIEYDKELFFARAGIPTDVTFRYIADQFNITELDPNKATLIKRGYYLKNLHKISIIEPVFEIVKYYHGKLPMGIGTGGYPDAVHAALKKTGLMEYFDPIITIADVERPKPYPDTFIKCALGIGVDPKDAIVFEDGPSGIKAAIDGGFQYIDVRDFI